MYLSCLGCDWSCTQSKWIASSRNGTAAYIQRMHTFRECNILTISNLDHPLPTVSHYCILCIYCCNITWTILSEHGYWHRNSTKRFRSWSHYTWLYHSLAELQVKKCFIHLRRYASCSHDIVHYCITPSHQTDTHYTATLLLATVPTVHVVHTWVHTCQCSVH